MGIIIFQIQKEIKKEVILQIENELFLKMIQGKTTADEMDELEEAGVLADIAHMPARVKCAVLGWHTMEEMLGKKE